MVNPWIEILLDDYENHMRLGSVMQLQTMNQMSMYKNANMQKCMGWISILTIFRRVPSDILI